MEENWTNFNKEICISSPFDNWLEVSSLVKSSSCFAIIISTMQKKGNKISSHIFRTNLNQVTICKTKREKKVHLKEFSNRT